MNLKGEEELFVLDFFQNREKPEIQPGELIKKLVWFGGISIQGDPHLKSQPFGFIYNHSNTSVTFDFKFDPLIKQLPTSPPYCPKGTFFAPFFAHSFHSGFQLTLALNSPTQSLWEIFPLLDLLTRDFGLNPISLGRWRRRLIPLLLDPNDLNEAFSLEQTEFFTIFKGSLLHKETGLPPEKLTQWWNFQFNRGELLQEYSPEIVIPKVAIIQLKATGEFFTSSGFLGYGTPFILIHSDWVEISVSQEKLTGNLGGFQTFFIKRDPLINYLRGIGVVGKPACHPQISLPFDLYPKGLINPFMDLPFEDLILENELEKKDPKNF